MFCAFKSRLGNLLTQRSQICSPQFLSRSIKVFLLTFYSLIHQELVFVYGVKLGFNRIYVQFFYWLFFVILSFYTFIYFLKIYFQLQLILNIILY